jgi:hypothetical protein
MTHDDSPPAEAERGEAAANRRRRAFTITLIQLPGAEGVHGLRRLLKFALRSCRLRCIDIREGNP